MFEQVLELPPRPIELARRLAGRDGVSLLWAQGGRVAYLACDPLERSQALDPDPELVLGSRTPLHAVPRWMGLLPYECRRDLERSGRDQRAQPHLSEPLWLRYDAVAMIASSGVRVLGEGREPVQRLARLLGSAACAPAPLELGALGEFEAEELHQRRIRRALEHIVAGDLYQVNLARRFDFRVRGSAIEVLARMLGQTVAVHAAGFSWGELEVASVSPELFLSLDTSGAVLTSPIKGTRPRGKTAPIDAELVRELDRDPKERAELTMVIDVERNDLARLARPGSVELVRGPHVETHGTVHHRVATLRAELRSGISRRELLLGMLPSGSVTGAPKVRAMELIAELETERRGLYTGAFGFVAHDGSMELGMAIRTLSVRDGQGHYFAGGGIVADSDPEREVQETLWKAEALLGLLR